MALTLAELEARFPEGPSVAYRTAAERARVVLPGELGEVIAMELESHASIRDVECSGRRLNPRSWLISGGAPNALAAVLLEPKEEPMPERTGSAAGVKWYRKKPVTVEAIQFGGGAEPASTIIDWINRHDGTATWHEAHDAWESEDGNQGYSARPEGIEIHTREGVMAASVGDWIIRGVKGEFYPCKSDIFEATYEAVHPGDAGS